MSSILKVDQLQDSGGNSIISSNGSGTFTSSLPNTGITMADQWRVNTVFTADSTLTTISSNFEQIDSTGQGTIGTAMSESSGIFTFPSTGIYFVRATLSAYRSADARYVNLQIQATTDNSSYAVIAQSYDSIEQAEGSSTYANPTTESFIDVTDTSNVKVRFQLRATQVVNIKASTDNNENSFTFIRLGDT